MISIDDDCLEWCNCCESTEEHTKLLELYHRDPAAALEVICRLAEDEADQAGLGDVSWKCGEGGKIEFLETYFPEDLEKYFPSPMEFDSLIPTIVVLIGLLVIIIFALQLLDSYA